MASLDILRGLAILLVFGRHHPLDPKSYPGLWKWPGLVWLRWGWTGVDLFFVLSGFLVGGLLMREIRETSTLAPKRFLLRRGMKIWPGYYVYLLALPLFALLQGLQRDKVGRYIWNRLAVCYANLQNYAPDVIPRFHLWSLAVEEHFYLLLTGLLWFLTPKGRKSQMQRLPWILAGVLITCTLLRAQAAAAGYNPLFITYATHLRIDSLAFGVLLAWLYHFRPEKWKAIAGRHRTLLAGFAVLVSAGGALRQGFIFFMLGFPMLYAGYGMLLIALVQPPVGGPVERFTRSAVGRLIAWVGLYSYSIYLWHLDAGGRLVASFTRTARMPAVYEWPAATAIYLIGGILAGVLMARVLEYPVVALRDRILPSGYTALNIPRSAPATQSQAAAGL